jgi:hypothetical protein
MRARTYVIIVLGLAATLAGAVIVLNARVDPYGLVAGPDTTNLAPDTPRPGAFWRKALTVRNTMPRTIVLGTSRAEFGIDPRSSAFASEYAPVLNLSLGGLSVEQMRLMLIHGNTVSPLRLAVIGLDLESFLDAGRTDFDAAALEGNRESEPQALVRLRLDISREALSATLAQLMVPAAASAELPAVSVGPREWRISEPGLKLWDGQHGLIWAAEYDNFYARLPLLFPSASAASRWDAEPRRAAAMASFRELLRYAGSHDIELRMFISPVHARYLEWYRHVGWWPLFEAWKRALVDAIDAEAIGPAARPSVALWDFGSFHSIATEAVPPIGDHTTHMRWYRDTSHYSPDVGDLVLARVLSVPGLETSLLPDVRLTKATIDDRISRVRLEAARYRLAAPDESADIDEMLAYLRRVGRR